MAQISPLDARLAHSNQGVSTMNLQRYATKKSIAQSLLDVSLLTANVSQLKYVLQVGHRHEFYTLLLTLLSVAIFLQMSTGVLNLSMNLLNDCQLRSEKMNRSSNMINYIVTGSALLVTIINLLISAFDPTILRYLSA